MNFITVLTKFVSQFSKIKEKEVRKMTRKIIASIMILGMIFSAVSPASAAVTIVGTTSVAATASVAAIETLSVATYKTSDNTVTSPASTLAFGTVGSTVVNAPAYVKVNYSCNDTLWAICVYTNNTSASSSTATSNLVRYQRSGMLKSDGTDRIPMYWTVYTGTATPPALPLTNGAPTARTPSKYPVGGTVATNKVTDWAVLKDKTDTTDPAILAAGTDTSWTAAFGNTVSQFGGYCDILYGTPSFNNINPFPYYDVAPGVTGTWDPVGSNDNLYPAPNSTIHRAGSAPAYVYLAAFGGTASAGTYTTSVSFDLYHQ